MLITTSEALYEYCEKIASSNFITIDTEFIRERTYYPHLCLMQIASEDPDVAFAIDMLHPSIDYAPLIGLLTHPGIVKVFHSARQDIEAILYHLHVFPAPLFDTQIAAMACGFGESIGYANIVESLTGNILDKKYRFSDWARRPLLPKQIEYALADVTHLREIYKILKKQLEDNHRFLWLKEEWDTLHNPAHYQTLPEEAWRKIKISGHNNKTIYMIAQLAEFREKEAQMRNIPRNFVLKDQILVELAIFKPISREQLSQIRSVLHQPEGFLQEICHVVSSALEKYDAHNFNAIIPKFYNKNQNEVLVELLRIILKHQARIHGVAESLIASSEDLRLLASEAKEEHVLIKQSRALQGWRYDVFGQYAMALKKGTLHISVEGDTLVFHFSNPSE